MSIKRSDLIIYLKENGYYLLRESGKHSIYSNKIKQYQSKDTELNCK